MSTQELTEKEKAFSPGHIIYNGKTTVTRPGFESSLETIRFILSVIPNRNNLLEGKLLDENWELLTDKIWLFISIEEFFALNGYIVRNGVAVNPPKKI